MPNNISVYTDYTFMDGDNYKYTLSVEDDFVDIEYRDYENNHWKKTDEFTLPTHFAYEIAKKIIEECEKHGYIFKI